MKNEAKKDKATTTLTLDEAAKILPTLKEWLELLRMSGKKARLRCSN